MKRILALGIGLMLVAGMTSVGLTADMEILGVTFPGEKVVAGKTLQLNGVSYRKALGFIKVFAQGLYLEKPTHDAQEVINSEQIKNVVTHYLTSKATAEKIRDGVREAMEDCNSSELVTAHKADIDLLLSYMDKDMAPGLTTESTYIPGQGLIYAYQGVEKGTFQDPEFIKMFYRMSFGEEAPKRSREGLLGM